MTAIDALLARAREISSDAERVTEAKLRKVTLSARNGQAAGVLGLITLDNGEDHTKPNTFGPAACSRSNDAIDAALADDEVVAIGVTGKPFILAAGADLTSIAGGGRTRSGSSPSSATRCSASSRTAASRRSASSTASRSAAASRSRCTAPTAPSWTARPALGLPEVMLGLIPGWGGAYLVPNLVGADKAVTLIVENPLNQGKTLGGQAAYDFGLADAVLLRRRLPRAVAAVGGRRAHRSGRRRAGPRSTGARPGTPPSPAASRSRWRRPAAPARPRSRRSS